MQRKESRKYNPDRSRKYNPNRKWTPPRIKILEIKGKRCSKCGMENEHQSFFDIDHITPRRKIGKVRIGNNSLKEIDNLQILCPNCHRLKTIAEGWHNPRKTT